MSTEEYRPVCMTCGLLQLENPHPEAGHPKRINEIGTAYGCLPCAELRANGRLKTIHKMFGWLRRQQEGADVIGIEHVISELERLEDVRQGEFHTLCGPTLKDKSNEKS